VVSHTIREDEQSSFTIDNFAHEYRYSRFVDTLALRSVFMPFFGTRNTVVLEYEILTTECKQYLLVVSLNNSSLVASLMSPVVKWLVSSQSPNVDSTSRNHISPGDQEVEEDLTQLKFYIEEAELG
jgi:hypothetical protein